MSEIIETKPGDTDFYLFKDFPKEIYPLGIISSNPEEIIDGEILHSCYILMQDNKVCARAAVYNNPHLFYENKKALCIGNYESINNENVSSELFSYVLTDAKKCNADFLIGPINGSTWNNYRFSLHHNHPNFFLEPYHHLYYNGQFLNAGFNIIAKYFSSIDTSLNYDESNVVMLENQFKHSGVTFRNIELNNYYHELEKLYEFNTISFSKNFLYTPLSKEKFIKKYSETKNIIDPDFVIFAEDEKQNLIGYFFCVNDLLCTKQKSLIIKTIARHPDKKWKGLGHVIGNMIYRQAVKKNYASIVHAFMNEKGTSTTISKNFYGDVYKNYVLYGKEI